MDDAQEIAQILEDTIALGDQHWDEDEVWDEVSDRLNALVLRLRGPS